MKRSGHRPLCTLRLPRQGRREPQCVAGRERVVEDQDGPGITVGSSSTGSGDALRVRSAQARWSRAALVAGGSFSSGEEDGPVSASPNVPGSLR